MFIFKSELVAKRAALQLALSVLIISAKNGISQRKDHERDDEGRHAPRY